MNLRFFRKRTKPTSGVRGGVYFIVDEGKIYMYNDKWEDYTFLSGKLKNSITIGGKSFDGTNNITITKSDLGLENVDNTADRNKIVLQATNDGNGNNIVDYYIPKHSINNTSEATAYNNILYTSKIDNGFAALDKWAKITLSEEFFGNEGGANSLFSGNYETGITLTAGNTGVITIDFSSLPETKYSGYPYGDILFYFYYSWIPKSISVRIYNTFEPQGIGWKDLTVATLGNSALWSCKNTYYGFQKMEITITAKDDIQAKLTQIEFNRSRQSLDQPQPILFKYSPETLYYPLTAPSFIGNLNGTASSVEWIEY